MTHTGLCEYRREYRTHPSSFSTPSRPMTDARIAALVAQSEALADALAVAKVCVMGE